MRNKLLCVFLFILPLALKCFGECTYQGLTPGKSTRKDAESVLGQPVNKVSETVHEFGPKWSAKKIFVRYGKVSNVVHQIEVFLAEPVNPSDARMYFNFDSSADDPFGGNSPRHSETLKSTVLSARPAFTRTNKGKLQEYFGEQFYAVLTHAANDANSRVSQIGFYSRELFDVAASKPQGSETNGWEQRDQNMSYTGTNLTYYPEPSVDKCQSDCASNNKCVGFTWIAPGTYNTGDSAMCYLVSAVTGRSPAKGHTSAVKSNPGTKQE